MGIRVKYDPSRGLVSTYGEDEQGVDLPTLGIPNVISSTVDPTVNDDVTDGFQIGSRWWNTSSQEEFVCLSVAQGAAVWLSTTTGGGVSSGSSGGSGADPSAQYLLLSATGSLANERVFTVGTGLLGADSALARHIPLESTTQLLQRCPAQISQGLLLHLVVSPVRCKERRLDLATYSVPVERP